MTPETLADLRRCELQSMEQSTCYLRRGFEEEVKVFWSWEDEEADCSVGRREHSGVSVDSVWSGPLSLETGFLRYARTNVTKRLSKAVLAYIESQLRAELELRRKH